MRHAEADQADTLRLHEGDDAPGAEQAPGPAWWAALPAVVFVALGIALGMTLVDRFATAVALYIRACLP